ncbi:uncharacterized protein LOC116121587 [Pistacia vera]|uniref:uncharacterized protein LOC116121587 n=1 Tax=Pistacia vera TaxID=55513 RepID=UPI001263C487|nr:uncharacterized protein LOC116121587 [Pistacia vera]
MADVVANQVGGSFGDANDAQRNVFDLGAFVGDLTFEEYASGDDTSLEGLEKGLKNVKTMMLFSFFIFLVRRFKILALALKLSLEVQILSSCSQGSLFKLSIVTNIKLHQMCHFCHLSNINEKLQTLNYVMHSLCIFHVTLCCYEN